jgi:hypothetical protein
MPVSKEQVKELLGAGLTGEQVASAVGCVSSYISTLLADEKFADEVAQLRAASIQEYNRRDKSIDNIEDVLISKLKDVVDQELIYKPRDLLQAFSVVNRAQRRGNPNRTPPITNQQIVTLNIPVKILQQFQVSATGEVIQVDDKTLVTMPSDNLLKHLHSQGGENGQRYAQVAKYLPTTRVPEDKSIGD